MARSKISFSLEIFNLARNFVFFLSFGPSGLVNVSDVFSFALLGPGGDGGGIRGSGREDQFLIEN